MVTQAPMRSTVLFTVVAAASALAPRWTPTWVLAESTIIQPCNMSGFLDTAFFSQFGLVDVDWSNAKQLWVDPPMDCQELLVEQCALLKAANPKLKCFVYRNLVKALPWYTSVRDVINDAAHSGWFLPFVNTTGPFHVPMCDTNWDPPRCSALYHDQEQTPEYPHGDGSCPGPCDCGGVPCGEYLWNHRNASLRSWFINEYILGSAGLANPNISGFFLDDGWSNKTQPVQNWMPQPNGYCDCSPIGGPSEENYHCVDDMGLVQADTTEITEAWAATMGIVRQVIVGAGGWAWQYFASHSTPPANRCVTQLREFCSQGVEWPPYSHGVQFAWTLQNGTSPLPQPDLDIATFQLLRGPYWWIGYSWVGCAAEYDFPDALKEGYGIPLNSCTETSPGAGVFTRMWSKANVSVDCNSYSSATTFFEA